MAMHRTVGTFAAAFKGVQRSFKDEKRTPVLLMQRGEFRLRTSHADDAAADGRGRGQGRGSRDRGLKSEKKEAISTFI